MTFEDNSGKVTSEIEYTYDLFQLYNPTTHLHHLRIGRRDGSHHRSTQRYVFDSLSPLPLGEGQGVRASDVVLAFDGDGDLTDRFLWAPAVDQVLADEQFSSPSGKDPMKGTAADLAPDGARRHSLVPGRQPELRPRRGQRRRHAGRAYCL